MRDILRRQQNVSLGSDTSNDDNGFTGSIPVITLGAENIPLLVPSRPSPNPRQTLQNPDIHTIVACGELNALKSILLEIDTLNNTVEKQNKIYQILFSKSVSRKNRNVFHLAAGFQGDPDIACQCVMAIFDFAGKNCTDEGLLGIVNAVDDEGDTPLYLAAKNENFEACKALLYSSDLDIFNKRYKTPIMKLFKKMPLILTEIFTQSGTNSYFVDGERQVVRFHFRTLITIPTAEDIIKRSAGLYREMDFLANLSFTPLKARAQILNDVHVKTLVWLKWQHYKVIFWLTRFFQISWFLLYFFFLLDVYRIYCPYPGEKIYNFTWITTVASSQFYNGSDTDFQLFSERDCAPTYLKFIGWILMLSAVIDGLLIEFYPTLVRFRRKWHPMKTKSFRKYAEQFILLCGILHLGTLFFLATIFINTIPVNFKFHMIPTEWQYIFASIGIFMSWFQIFLQLGKFPQFKGYIKMLTNTIFTLCIVGLLYFPLLIAFAMVFCVLLPGEVTYASPFEALLRMSTFTIGEVDFEDTFYGDEASPPASFVVTAIFFGIAIIILHIALLNFLIGVTINELQDVWKQAEVWRTYTYLYQIFLCETFISHFPFGFCQNFLMNRMVLKCAYKNVDCITYENRETYYTTKLELLPKNLRKEIRLLKLKFIPSN